VYQRSEPADKRKPVIRGRASICECSIQVKVLWRSQLDELIPYLTSEGYSFHWEVINGDSVRPEEFTLTIGPICWAYNATAILQRLEACDYQEDLISAEEQDNATTDVQV
jgi:hypothetical protein